MKNFSFLKKIMSAALSLALVFSLFAITPSKAVTATLKLDKGSFFSATNKSTIIRSNPSAVYYSRASESSAWEPQLVAVTNAIYSKSSSTATVGSEGSAVRSFGDYTGATLTKIHTDGKLRYLDITYDLGSVCGISEIAIMSAPSTKYQNESALGAYKLFAYNEKSELGLASSLVYDYNYANQTADSSDPYLYQTYSLSLNARFVTLRITRATIVDAMKTPSDLSTTVPRLFCSIFGTRKFDISVKTGIHSTNEAAFGSLGASVICGNPTVYYAKKNSQTGYFERKTGVYSGTLQNLWDGNIEDQSGSAQTMMSADEMKFAIPESTCHSCGTAYAENDKSNTCKNEDCQASRWAEKYYTDGTEHFVDIEYDLGQVKEIENIAISNHKEKILQTSHFRIYVSNSIDDLYIPESLVYERTTDTATIKDITISFTTKTSGRYVAMRVYNACGGTAEELAAHGTTKLYTNAYIRLFEFNVFGNDPYSTKNPNADIITYSKTLKSEKSLIEGKNPSKSFAFVDGQEYSLNEKIYEVDETGSPIKDENNTNIAIESQYPNFGILTNDEVLHDDEIRSAQGNMLFVDDSGNIIDDESKLYLQFNYKLDAPTKINSLEVYGHQRAVLSPSHMKFSIANSEAELFTDSAAFNSGDIRSASNGIGAKLNVPSVGTYVGIRIICAVQPNCGLSRGNAYARIREISIYGDYESTATLPTLYRQLHLESGIRKNILDAEISSDCALDTSGNMPLGTTVTYKAPVSFRYSGEIYSFYSWTNTSGETVSEDLSYAYNTADGENQLYANYKKITDKMVKFKFLNKQGESVYETDVIFGHYLTREQYENANRSIGSLAGYEVKKELVSFGSRTAVMPVWSEDIYNTAAETETSFYPIYVPEEKTYSVSFGEDIRSCRFDTKLTFTNGSKVYWLVDGIVMSDSTTSFAMYATGDATITTASSGTTVPNIALFNKAYIRDYDATVFAKIVKVPSLGTIQEVGVIFADAGRLEESEYESKLVVGGSDVITASAQRYSQNNGFAITLKNVGRKRVRVARAYMTYKPIFGNAKTVYSNIILIET